MKETVDPKNLRVVFMGTSAFAAPLLDRLAFEDYKIVGVYTKPDSKAGRRQQLEASQIKQSAQKHNYSILQPAKFDDTAFVELKALKPDLIIVAAYGKILPERVLELPKYGCLNIHPSLLPKLRGPSPIQNTLLLGLTETGTTLMLLDAGMDTGDIIAQKNLTVVEKDNARTLSRKLALLSADLLAETLPHWVNHEITAQKQNPAQATLCQLIEREDGRIYWHQEAEEINHRFRALFGWPGVFTHFHRGYTILRLKLLKISWQATDPQVKRKTGEVFETNGKVAVQTGAGLIFLEQVQLEGKSPMEIKTFLNGYKDFMGTILE